MNERMKQLRLNLNMTQQSFADAIQLSRNYIVQIEMGLKTPGDRTIRDICRRFNVNETWLRTGEGDMFVKRSRDEEIAEFMGYLISDDSNPTMKRFIKAFSKLDPADWDVIQKIMDALLEEQEAEQKKEE